MQIIFLVVGLLLSFAHVALAQQTIVGGRLRIAGESQLSGDVGHPDYVSQLTNWLITQEGAGDFRYLFTDEMHAKSFIADLEQALAGGQIITKSVTLLASNYTVPALGAASTITVKDLPSAENMAVFESGDTIRLRTLSRASGSLTIADAYGVVTAYADQAGGVQTWTFTRNAGADGGGMAGATVIQADAIVLDYGVTGNGYYEVNAIDGLYGVNSPYARIATWATSPIGANQAIRTQFGNLLGITGTAGEYGMIAGSYDATPDSSTGYFRASNSAFDLVGINLSLYDGATRTFHFDRSVPSFAMGNGAPSGYSTGVGCWQGKDAGVYKWRCGDPAGDLIAWDGTSLIIAGVGSSVAWTDVTGRPAELTDGRIASAIAVGGGLLNTVIAAPSGTGLFLGSDKLGFYDAGVWKTYMDNAGNFYLGGTSGSLQWNGTTLTIVGSGTFTGSVTASSGTIGGFTLSSTTLSADNLTLSNTGNITVGTGNNVARMSDDGTIRLWAGHATAASAPFQVSQTGALTASSVDITGGSIDIGAVTLDSNGILITQGTGDSNKLEWSDSSFIYGSSGTLVLRANSSEVILQAGGTTQARLSSSAWYPPFGTPDLGTNGDRWRTLYLDNDLIMAGDIFFTPPTTTSPDPPLVYSIANGIPYRKTDVHSGTCNSNFVVESGIIVSCDP